MNLDYLLLPRLEIQAANAQSAWWLINAAPVVAATLFAHNLGRRTGVFPEAVGIVHHHGQLLGERFYGKLRPQQRRGAVFIDGNDYPQPRTGEKQRPQLSLQPTASCHLNWSLLLAFDGRQGVPPMPKVESFLAGARLAGGQIVDRAQPLALENREEVQKTVRSGHWIVERMDLMAPAEGDPLDALIRATTRPAPRRDEEKHGETTVSAAGPAELPASWIVPATLGYAAVTEFARRGGVREGYLHAYAEPLVGLVQYVSVHEFAGRPLPLWRHGWPRDDVFVVTQKEP
jgi:CRISPR-associated protein Csy2